MPGPAASRSTGVDPKHQGETAAPSGKTVLLTGSSKGIGAATAAVLGRAGYYLVAHYGSDSAGARAATADVPADRVLLVGADLARTDEVDRLWREALAWRGRIDVLVNNAAVMRLAGGVEADEAEWDQVWAEALQVNVLAPVRLMRHAVRHYRDLGGGIIVTVSSWAAQRGPGNPDLLAYATSKGAVLSATKTVARSYAKDGVLAYVVAPGVVRTRLSETASAATGGEATVTATLAMGEWVPRTEVAELIAFLATGTCRHLTGATLDVNGASYIR
jgi:NAD(P)-dependent dehydrogenase (short-subunit alcohol dehydrogenase family)